MEKITPETYFPQMFLEDQENYLEGQPSFICGGMIIRLGENSDEYNSPEHFLVCLYELNLLDQAVYTYFGEDSDLWKSISPLKVDCRNNCHGVYHPFDIIRCTRQHLETVKITRDFLLRYDKFFYKYVEDKCKEHHFAELNPSELLNRLKADEDNIRPMEMMKGNLRIMTSSGEKHIFPS